MTRRYDPAKARALRIAVVGKGGSGKSVVAGTMARVLARSGHRVLTLDSDLVPGLSLSLGLGVNSSAMLADAVEKNEQGRWRLRKGLGPFRAVIRYAAVGPDGIRHLQCGKYDAEGMPTILGSISGFYLVVDRLARVRSLEGWTIIGDLPAGPRQLAYRWAPYANTFLVMVEPSWKSVLTARRIVAILRSESGTMVIPVANKVTGSAERRSVEEILGEPVVAAIPLDPALADAERAGRAPLDAASTAPAVRAIEALTQRLVDSHHPATRVA